MYLQMDAYPYPYAKLKTKKQTRMTTMYPTALLPPSSTRKASMSVAAVTIENNIPRELESNRAFRPTCAGQRANS